MLHNALWQLVRASHFYFGN
uniref:Uncharacterized protein n=1 Tax=Arundo donax TaxID=35708 RepID=A0A0A8ZE53_ARUDO